MLDSYRRRIFTECAGGDSTAAEYFGRRLPEELPKKRTSTVSLPNVSHIHVLLTKRLTATDHGMTITARAV